MQLGIAEYLHEISSSDSTIATLIWRVSSVVREDCIRALVEIQGGRQVPIGCFRPPSIASMACRSNWTFSLSRR
ncbi:hypothetical protein BTHE_1852 [Bifidobacterium thermophilum]|nr:hypothetical protein BTHE_1852 [Bifidobacterium thermophilum]